MALMNGWMIVSAGVVLGVTGVLMGCNPPPEEKPQEVVKSDKLVARVASIHKEEGYALIQRYGRLRMKEDTILYTLSVDGKTSSLKVTGEKLGQYLAVDIVSGDLNIGDAVYLRDLAEEGKQEDKEVETNKGS